MTSNSKLKFFPFLLLFVLLFFVGCTKNETSQKVDLIVITQMIDAGKIKELTIKKEEVIAIDRSGTIFRTEISDEYLKSRLIKMAFEKDNNGKPKVEKIEDLGGDRRVPWSFGFWIVPLFVVLLAGVLGFMLGRASKTLR